MKVFVSCSFPVSHFTNECIKLGKAIGMDLHTVTAPHNGDIKAKIKEAINSSVGILFVLEPRTDGRNHSDWRAIEYAISEGLNLPFGIINNSEISIPEIFPNIEEYLVRNGNNTLEIENIVSYLYSLQKKMNLEKHVH